MTFKELREQSSMNMKQFAAHFEIPYRTIQNWEAGVNKCPEYLLKLMKFRLDRETPGEWIGIQYDGYADGCPVYDLWECSCCRDEYESEGDPPPYNYCPNCGAKMV